MATISSESRIAERWRELRAAQRPGLVPYLTAGFPDRDTCREALRRVDRYADILEVGVPFSDPLADGPTIQASTFQALANGTTLAGTLDLIANAELRSPVVLFTYLNPVLQYGLDRLLRDAADAGVSGLLLTDLPAGSDPSIETAIGGSALDLIRLVAPTTSEHRLRLVVKGARGFVYLIARLGVTGATAELAADLRQSVARVRAATALPIAVGFGVSTPAQAREVGAIADGVVIGSALVDRLGRDGPEGAETFVAGIRAALDRGE
ncbi:MAG: tryptophan synthase subunit alpha [Gemmatimonadales bacterium]